MSRAIAITPGEPAGIGPDICLQWMRDPPPCACVLIADAAMLRARAQQLKIPFDLPAWPGRAQARKGFYVLSLSTPQPVQAGVLNIANAPYVLATLDRAVDGCLSGEFDALVTGPVHKGIINEAGTSFSGHTEYLAHRTGARQVVMMLQTEGLRVALVTTHIPLAEVSRHITTAHLKNIIVTLAASLRERLGLQQPRILVCGLNPHAGEDGHLGREELDIIIPALEELRRGNPKYILLGPAPADTAFAPDQLAQCDVVLTMYHDQGLPVLNHGTALALAGSGRAHAGSLRAAFAAAYDAVRT